MTLLTGKDELGLLLDIPVSHWINDEADDQGSPYMVPRAIYFLDEDTFSVTFFGDGPIGCVLRVWEAIVGLIFSSLSGFFLAHASLSYRL